MTNPLQRLVQNRLAELDLTLRAASRRSGGLVSYTTVHNFATGKHRGNISEDTIRGLALALDVPASQIRELAGQGEPPKEFRLPKRAEKLTPMQRKAVLRMVDALLENNVDQGDVAEEA